MEHLPRNYCETMPRTDYPRPMWRRGEWYCLNGEWEFEFDFGVSGESRKMYIDGDFSRKITVPFCPESTLSGLGYTDFIPAVWYRKEICVAKPDGCRAILHFGAVDYESKVWVNGQLCGTHVGGCCAFEYDITQYLREGTNVIVVMAIDDVRSPLQPTGKQSTEYHSYACSYTRTTGIWQSVWLEYVPQVYLHSAKMTPHAADGTIDITVKASSRNMRGYSAVLTASYHGKQVGQAAASFVGDSAAVQLRVNETHLWDVGQPELYDLKVELICDAQCIDSVDSYFALRDIAYNENGLVINGRPVFMRLILDQGFNPQGIYTAPTAEFLQKDIRLAMDLGFNGARLHQRVFEERTLYYADTMGYIVWAETPCVGLDLSTGEATEVLLSEWLEIVNSHYNHPAVVGWCPFNESYHEKCLHKQTHTTVYRVTKALDPYRPVIDASGGVHYETDMFDVHDYEQDPQKLAQYLEPMLHDPACHHSPIPRYRSAAPAYPEDYRGQPYWVSEYGGTLWAPRVGNEDEELMGYGDAPRTEAEFIARYEGLTDVLLAHPRVCGFCYTQLTDVEQEQNGLYFYDREKKFGENVYARIRAVNTKQAAIEGK